jgi:hypothetical protein
MSWDRMKKTGGNKNFVKLKEGESIVGVFRGEPYVFYRTFGEQVEHDTWAEGRAFRFRINFITKDGEEYKARIFENGSKVRDILMSCNEEYGLDAVYKIVRKGVGTDTTYNILFQSKLLAEQIQKMDALPLEVLRFGGAKRSQSIPEDDIPPHTDADKPAEEPDPLPF